MNPVSLTEDDVKKIHYIKFGIENELFKRMNTLPPGIQILIRLYGVVTGGISASIAHNEKPNDVDVYLTLDDARVAFMEMLKEEETREYIADVNPKYMIDTSIPGKLATAHAVTFKCGIQIVTMHLSNARNSFDYIHTMPYYHCDSKKYYISPQQLEAIKNKKLIRNTSPEAFPLTEKRMQKFIDRGWTI